MTSIPTILLLTFHLLAMQLAGAGPLLAALLDLLGKRHPILERLTEWSWVAFWIGVILGGAVAGTQILFGQREYAPALEMLGYKLKWGVAELVVFAVAMWLYRWGWSRLRGTRTSRGWHITIGLFAATNLLYHFPTLMLLFSRVVSGRIALSEPMDAATYRAFAFAGPILAASIHFWLASLVVAGVSLALLVIREATTGRDDGENNDGPIISDGDVRELTAREVGSWGIGVALVAAMSQLPVGMWLVAVLESPIQAEVLGKNLWTTGLLGLAVFAAFGLMHDLASITFGDWSQKTVTGSAAKLIIVTLIMVATSMRLGS